MKGIIGMHRFNMCLVVVLLWCENTITLSSDWSTVYCGVVVVVVVHDGGHLLQALRLRPFEGHLQSGVGNNWHSLTV